MSEKLPLNEAVNIGDLISAIIEPGQILMIYRAKHSDAFSLRVMETNPRVKAATVTSKVSLGSNLEETLFLLSKRDS